MPCSGCPTLHGVIPNKKSTPNYKNNKIRPTDTLKVHKFKSKFIFSPPGNDLGPLDVKSDLLTIRPRIFQIALRGGERLEILLGEDFFNRWLEPGEDWFWAFETFSKLKTDFCEYWTSIKIKISINWVYKEYEIKTKMVQEQMTTAKDRVFIGL